MKRLAVMVASVAVLLAPLSVGAVDGATETSGSQPTAMRSERVREAKDSMRTKVLEEKMKAQQRKMTVTAERCEKLKTQLIRVVPKLSQDLKSVKENLDKHYTHIKSLHDSGKLSTANYDSLVTAADAAKAKAETAMSLVDPSSVTVDCAEKGLGSQLDTYRSTIKEARTALKDYRKSLVDLVSALRASADKTATATEEGSNASN